MTFSLDKNNERPVILLNEIFEGCSALIDTGALFPVWTKAEEVLKAVYNPILVEKDKTFTGFGTEAKGNLYKIDLVLRDIMFPQMPIISCFNEAIPGFFLFSATMFEKMDYHKKIVLRN